MKLKLTSLFQLPRRYKKLISALFDAFCIIFALLLSYWIRMGETPSMIEQLHLSSASMLVGLTLVFTLLIYSKLGLYKAMLRYMTLHVMSKIFIGAIGSAILLTAFAHLFNNFMPRSIPIIYASLLVILSGGIRLFLRSVVIEHISNVQRGRVLVYGAGSAGRQLTAAMRSSETYRMCGFIDDNEIIQGSMISNYPVYGPDRLASIIKQDRIDTILLALPRESRLRRKQIIESLLELKVEVLSMPSLESILENQDDGFKVQDVPVEDLLGRDAVPPKKELLQQDITDKVVMVTGAGGSIGSEICRQALLQSPKILVLFEVTELALYSIEKELSAMKVQRGLETRIIPLLGSVQRINRLSKIMSAFKVETIYHAAAYKHVPMVEYNVVEGVRNNVFGTFYTAKAAVEAGVNTFVLISTDKAVRPTNIMGTSKRLAELGVQALANKYHNVPGTPRFSMVRFGNVLGSSGSVIPLFKKQIANGGPVTITHPEITRYFMTIPEASQLVIQAGAMAKGGDVFVLDMGESVKITDLAKNLIRLSGLTPKSEEEPFGDIEIKFTGLRPGEKLYEELLVGADELKTSHQQVMRAQEEFLVFDEFMALLDKLDSACHDYDYEAIHHILLNAPAAFNPTDGIGDLVWQEVRSNVSLQESGVRS
ncbi:polysaccharide biosynthesis protein WbpM [Vibrio halioticoli NBRC 102217]|uniref:Polysaccharide biosynthesis protein WbpM n=1 Tax=Vibrio halioticoli NBRC 102217 TaxID=1219072 RepID=V5F496_9VIBR|nr:nucleoside-diphosphate sugar epimerase/dehydratase [Vibrio halioticoli]GAD90069.1 polysaccharide biosynthesis protein WbpM [Vibrio halioticoli NBRC 102217]